MLIKKFSPGYLKGAAKVCRSALHNDIMPDFLLMEKTYGDPDYDPSLTYVSLDDDEITVKGFIQGVIRNYSGTSTGYIKIIAVDPGVQKQGTGRQLYSLVEKSIKEKGIQKIIAASAHPNYFFPGIDQAYPAAVRFFESLNFNKTDESVIIKADLLSQNFDAGEADIRKALPSAKGNAIDFIKHINPAAAQLVKKAFEEEDVTLNILYKNGTVAGIAGYELNNKGTGWLEPFYCPVEEDAAALLKRTMFSLKEPGFVKAIIPASGNKPFFLRYINRCTERFFSHYEKNME